MLIVKNFEVPAHEPPLRRNQCLPAWMAADAGPQYLYAGFPSIFDCPGVQPALRARPAWAEREPASRRAMQAARISAGRLRGGHSARTRDGLAQQLKEPVTLMRGTKCVEPVKVPALRLFFSVTFTSLSKPFRSQALPL